MANLILIQALAELAYAIAMADGAWQPGEKVTFEKIIEAEWKIVEKFKKDIELA